MDWQYSQRLLAGLTAALTAAPALADVHIVDDSGAADFADIQPAVDASLEGDSILVRPGVYSGFTVNALGLTILGEEGARVSGSSRIVGLELDQLVVVSNLRLEGDPDRALELLDNQGSVHLQSCQLFGAPGTYHDDLYQCPKTDGSDALWILRSRGVFLTDCSVQGAAGLYLDGPLCGPGSDGLPGHDGARIEDSSIALYDCSIRGGRGGDLSYGDYFHTAGHGGSGCRALGSFVFTSNSLFTGGQGGEFDCGDINESGFGGWGGGGLVFASVSPSEANLLDSQFVGGPGGYGCFGNGVPGAGLANTTGSSIEHLVGTSRTMVIEHWVQGSSTVQAIFRGLPGDLVYLPADTASHFTYDASLRGVWQLETPVVDLGEPLGVIPTSGELALTIHLPEPEPGQSAVTSFRQAYVVDDLGEAILGTPDGTTLLAPCRVETYCTAAPNSSGLAAAISHSGSTSLAANDLVLHVNGAIPGEVCIFYYGSDPAELPFGDGLRCIGEEAFRLPLVTADSMGTVQYEVDYTLPPLDGGVGEISWGATWRFQLWYRDPAGPSGFNLSDGLAATFCP